MRRMIWKGLGGSLLLALLWWYVPPLGRRVDLPDIEPFLAPSLAHGKPTFIDTGTQVYYRVRLNRPVLPGFSWSYYEELHRRGVQIVETTTSPHLPVQHRTGWGIAMAREKELSPYTIEYWKTNVKGGSFPITLAWPWLYVRLGSDVLRPPRTSVLAPVETPLVLHPAVPRLPGAVLMTARQEERRITLGFWAQTSKTDVLAHYGEIFHPDILQSRRLFGSLKASDSLAAPLGHPTRVIVRVDNALYADYPLTVYPLDGLPTPGMPFQQPAGLTHLPRISHYDLAFHYESEERARLVFGQLVIGKGTHR